MAFAEYVRVIRRGWLWIVASVLTAVAGASALILATQPEYAVSTRLFLTTPLNDATLGAAISGSQFTQERVRSYADLVESDLLAERVVDSLDLDLDPADVAQNVSAGVVPDTVLLDIEYRDASPDDAEALAEAYADEFIDTVAEIEQQSSDGDPLVTATVINTPNSSSSQVSPQPVRTLALAGVLGLFVGIGIVVVRDLLDTSVSSAEQLSGISGSPGLGVIAYDPNAKAQPLIVAIAPRSPRAEAFRSLRTNLQFVDVDSPRKAITVTSSIPAEGKTTTAVNLAIALASADIRVLLLEADLRRPKVAEYLGLVRDVGLTNLLIGSAQLDDVVQYFGNTGLQVIASGPTPPNPSELLQSQAMHDLLDELRARADIVLIDSPPLLPVTDAAILASLSDGAILVTRYSHTKTDQVRRAVATLEQVGGKVLGSVLTMTPFKGRAAYHYQYSPPSGRHGPSKTSAYPRTRGESTGAAPGLDSTEAEEVSAS